MLMQQIMYIKELMSTGLVTLSPEDRIIEHLKIFEENEINHVPVLDSNREVIGLLTNRDFDNYVNIVKIIQAEAEDPIKVRDIMNERVFVYTENVHIESAAQAMVDNDIHAIVVVNEKKQLIGIVTSTDLLKHLANRERYRRF